MNNNSSGRRSVTKNVLFLLFLLISYQGGFASNPQKANLKETNITYTVVKENIEEIFNQLTKMTGFHFLYDDSILESNQLITIEVKNGSIDEILNQINKQTGLNFKKTDHTIAVTDRNNQSTVNNSLPSPTQESKRITGVIYDETGLPVIGANIMIKGTGQGTITDIDGEFSLTDIPENAILQITYIGYLSKEVRVGQQNHLKIELIEDSRTLDEVVVIGYGVQRKANLTGAVSQVKMEEVLGDRPVINAVTALQGAIPGLTITGNHQPGGNDKQFQIRDAFSLGSGAAIRPLVLIDNVEGNIDMINPDDIESVTVLKDAASSAIYGARAAGGVIIISTKQPKNNTQFRLNYNNNFGFEQAINLPKQTDLDTYFGMYLEAGLGTNYWANGQDVAKWRQYLQEYKANPSAFNIVGDGLYVGDDGLIYYLNERDKYKEFMETSAMMTHNISASGGTDKLRYRISGGFSSQDGPLITSADKYKRLNVGAFISADVTSWFTQVVDIKYARSDKSMPGNATGNLYNTRLLSYYPEGRIGSAYGFEEEYPVNTPRNNILYGNNDNTQRANPRIFLKSIFNPVKDLEAVFEYTFDKRDVKYDYFSGQYLYTDIQQGLSNSIANDKYTKNHNFTDYNAFNIYATYSKSFRNHNFKVMAGFNQESNYYEEVKATVYKQAVPEVPSLAGTTDKTLSELTDSYTEYTIRGGFFRFNYNYDNRYLLEVNGRYDGSSKFPKESRFGFFPSVSLGWQLGREAFMESTQSWLNELKLRASWGQIGNQNINAYLFTPSMELKTGDSWLNNDAVVNTIGLPSLVRDNFTWEKVATTNLGVDMALLDLRLRGSFEVYRRNTTGMLAPGVQLPAVVGASAPYQNTADMQTNGWELAINWQDRIGKVGYSIGFNIYDYRSKVTRYNNESGLFYARNEAQDAKRYRTGMYIGEIWGYVYDGFYTIDDFVDTDSWQLKEGVTGIDGYTSRLRPGDIKFKNLSDADGTENMITAGAGTVEDPGDRKIIGNSNPRYQYGANVGINYSGFDLSIMLQGVGKRDCWLGDAAIFPFGGAGPSDAVFRPVYYNQTDYWQPVDAANGDYSAANPNAFLPRIYDYTVANAVGSNTRISDRYLSSAAYLRVKNVTLSYTFPRHWIKTLKVEHLKVFTSMENLLTFSSLPKGYDPETRSWSYPCYRTISFGLNITF